MRIPLRIFVALLAIALLAASLAAQGGAGTIDISARVTPTGALPEPVRQFTFYVLTKSYADVIQEIESQNVLPTRDEFIDNLKLSKELRTWLKAHDLLDLTSPDLDKVLTTDDIMNVPEFFAAYERSNSGGVTKGFPLPKYRDSDKQANPEKYQKQKEEFLSSTRKFIETHPSSVQGIELELIGINPKITWDNLHLDHASRVTQLGPDTAQLKYLAGKVVTDLDGRARLTPLPPGKYWISSLGMQATSGDRRLMWDVPVTLQAGQTLHVDLSNLNAVDVRRSPAP